MSIEASHPAEREAYEEAVGPPPSEEPETVHLWQGRDGFWHWAYSDGNGTRLESNRSYSDRGSALESAEIAYPQVVVIEEGDVTPSSERSGLKRTLVDAGIVIGALGAVLMLIGLGAVVALALGVRILLKRMRRAAR